LASNIKFTNKSDMPHIALYKPPDGRANSHSHDASIWHEEGRSRNGEGHSAHISRSSRRAPSISEQSLVSIARPDAARLQSPEGQGIIKTVQIDVYDSKR
jgi:hypothetical protein